MVMSLNSSGYLKYSCGCTVSDGVGYTIQIPTHLREPRNDKPMQLVWCVADRLHFAQLRLSALTKSTQKHSNCMADPFPDSNPGKSCTGLRPTAFGSGN